MDAIYTRQWLDEHENKEYTKILKILPEGSIYRIVEKLCLDKLVIKEETWIATYGWHSNGHLIEIEVFATAFLMLYDRPYTLSHMMMLITKPSMFITRFKSTNNEKANYIVDGNLRAYHTTKTS